MNVLGRYKCIKDDVRDKVVAIEVEVEVDIGGWDMQQPEDLLYLIRELELEK